MHEQILTTFPADELLNQFRQIVREEIREAENTKTRAKEPDELITRQITAELLGISLPTLNIWSRQKRLTAYRIGSRIRYKRNEVIDACKQINRYGRQ